MTRQMPMWEKKIFATNRKTNEEFLWKTIIQYEFQEETNEQGIRTELVNDPNSQFCHLLQTGEIEELLK